MTSERSFPARTFGAGLVTTAAGCATLQLPIPDSVLVGGGLLTTGLLVTGGTVAWWSQGRRGTSATIGRWSRKSRRHDGVASRWDHLRVSSSWAMRRRATVLRPSLADLGWWQRYRTPVTEYATPLARAGWWR